MELNMGKNYISFNINLVGMIVPKYLLKVPKFFAQKIINVFCNFFKSIWRI